MSTTAAAAAPPAVWGALLRARRELDVPDGWRAEITGESITLSPPPGEPQNKTAHVIHWHLAQALPLEYGVYQTLGVRLSRAQALLVPDLLVAPFDARTFCGALPGQLALLAVEITGRGTPVDDRKRKLWAYAQGEVPLYLLVDEWDRAGAHVTLHSELRDGVYQRHLRVPFGARITLPGPFQTVLDTALFPRAAVSGRRG